MSSGLPKACQICYVDDPAKVIEPVATVCGHVFCWQCYHTWITFSKKVNCPSCKTVVSSISPLFLGVSRGIETDPSLPPRPIAGTDPSSFIPNDDIRRSSRPRSENRMFPAESYVLTNPEERGNVRDQGEEAGGQTRGRGHRGRGRGGGRGMRRGQESLRGNLGGGARGMRGGARGMRGGNITSVSVEEDLPNSDLADQHRVAFSPPYSALATLPLHSPGPQSPPALQSISGQDQQSSQGQAVPHAPHGQREEETVQHSVQTVAANSGEPMASAGRIIQGTTSTYQEAIILHARDYLLENGISVKELVYSDLVRYIRGSYPMAWKDRDASQAGKSLKHMLHKALNLRKEQKSFIMVNFEFKVLFLLAAFVGISGLRKNALQCALDEILTLNITAAMPPVNGEYLAEGTRRLSAAEKKRKGEALRRKGVTMPGPSRSREESVLRKMFEENIDYLRDIEAGRVESSRHQAFHKSNRTRHALYYTMITDPFTDVQLEWTLEEMGKVWMKTKREQIDNNEYVWKVLLAECFIKFYMDHFGFDKKETEKRISETPLRKEAAEESSSDDDM